jgi:Uma2 family endonuclease
MISGLIFVFLWFCIQKIGGKAYQDVEVVFDDENSVAPDVVYIAKNNTRCQITDKRLYGIPDLAIEILSASTGKRDRGEKYHLYEKYGVAEYWLIDPANQYVEVFIYNDGVYQRLGVFAPEDAFISPLLGQSVDVSALLRDPD